MSKEYIVTKDNWIPISKKATTNGKSYLDDVGCFGWKVKNIIPTKECFEGTWMYVNIVWEREVVEVKNFGKIIDSNTFYCLYSDIDHMELSIRLKKRIFELFYSKKIKDDCFNINKKVYEIVSFKEEDLVKIRGFGNKCLKELNDYLDSFGLHLGMRLSDDLLKKIKTTKPLTHKAPTL